MQRDEIDKALAAVEARVSTLGEELLTVEGQPVLKLLDAAGLTGVSRERLAPVHAQVHQVWEWFGALRRHVDLLRARLDATPRSGRGAAQEIDDIAATLHLGPVDVAGGANVPGVGGASARPKRAGGPSGPSAAGGPSATGGNAAGGATATAAALVERCGTVLSDARAALHELEERWRVVLPRLDAAGVKAAELRRESVALAEDHVGELSQAELDIGRVRELATSDPLATDVSDCDRIDARLASARRYLDDVRTRRETLSARVVQARTAIDGLRLVVAQAMASQGKASARVRDAGRATGPAAALSLSAIDDYGGLRPRLDEIAAKVSGDWRAADVALRALVGDIEDAHDAASSVLEGSTAVLDQRNELRGRLRAYRAKAQGTGRAEEATLNELYQRANEALISVPIDLDDAARAVDAYAAAVSGRAAARGAGQ